ncbi:MAG TPA: ATP-binding protein [Dongiaceae bacterium]|nr:ATP-binding protein [Dongiaceae bacterium]
MVELVPHLRTIGWFGTTSIAMGGINATIYVLGALFVGDAVIPGHGTVAAVLLAVGMVLSWVATPGWIELALMYPKRVGGIVATCVEAFHPYSPIVATLIGVGYWFAYATYVGLSAVFSAALISQWLFPSIPAGVLAVGIILVLAAISLCGLKWMARLAMPMAIATAALAFLSALLPVFSGTINWQRAFDYDLTVPFPGHFGELTSLMAGLFLVCWAAPPFELAASLVGETVNPARNVRRAMFASAWMATLYVVVLPVIWLGTVGSDALARDLATELGPTFAPLFGATAKAVAIWFVVLNGFHSSLAPLAGPPRLLAQLAEDGLAPEIFARRSSVDVPWISVLLTAAIGILIVIVGMPLWLLAATNFIYLISICFASISVWLLRRDAPDKFRPYRAPRGTIALGLGAAAIWGLSTVLGFQQFGLPTVLGGLAIAYSGVLFFVWRKIADRQKMRLPIVTGTLHLKLTGTMLLVLTLDAVGYLIAVYHVSADDMALLAVLADIFVAVALLTLGMGLILPGMIAHSATEISRAADRLVKGTLADFANAMLALADGDLNAAKANFTFTPVRIHSTDEIGDMANSFDRLQEEIGRAAVGLEGARKGLAEARDNLERRVAERTNDLANSLALLNATFNSTADGILASHFSSGERSYNAQFLTMWNLPPQRFEALSDSELIGLMASLVEHEEQFIARTRILHENPEAESFDIVELKDGRVFERYAKPQWIEGKIVGIVINYRDVSERKRAEGELERTHQKLLETSRLVGMADVASYVLHNVGNVLNSVNVSATVVVESVRGSEISALAKAVSLMREHEADIGNFISSDPRGKHLPAFLAQLSEHLQAEQQTNINELLLLRQNLDHIKEIVATQQRYAGISATAEMVDIRNIIEEGIRLNGSSGIDIMHEVGALPPANVDKHKFLQIIVNLISNAKDACLESKRSNSCVRLRAELRGDRIAIAISDNGIGISSENLTQIFKHGFTTKRHGHGFGLHSAALSAKEMGGSLRAQSDGIGEGAIFTLELPLNAAGGAI